MLSDDDAKLCIRRVREVWTMQAGSTNQRKAHICVLGRVLYWHAQVKELVTGTYPIHV